MSRVCRKFEVGYAFNQLRIYIRSYKVIFTYVSDDRVDFRQLLKDLAQHLHCRIELRQVGPRNKAKIVGGIGNCGMECCCSRFMSDFDTVSINMAKIKCWH